jgi:hypothetical protein
MTSQSVKDATIKAHAQPSLSDAKPKRRTRSKKARDERGAPAQSLTTTTTEAPRVELVELPDLPSFSEHERDVLRLIIVERKDPHEVARLFNERVNGQGWTVERVGEVLARARAKMVKAGEIEAARPSAYLTDETRRRYDCLLAELRAELERLPIDSSLFIMARVKIIKTIADVERLRGDALQAIAPIPGTLPGGAALVYVSRLRSQDAPSS